MPRPEAVLAGFGKLQELIGEGKANGANKYKENLEWYRANQKKVIPTWKRLNIIGDIVNSYTLIVIRFELITNNL